MVLPSLSPTVQSPTYDKYAVLGSPDSEIVVNVPMPGGDTAGFAQKVFRQTFCSTRAGGCGDPVVFVPGDETAPPHFEHRKSLKTCGLKDNPAAPKLYRKLAGEEDPLERPKRVEPEEVRDSGSVSATGSTGPQGHPAAVPTLPMKHVPSAGRTIAEKTGFAYIDNTFSNYVYRSYVDWLETAEGASVRAENDIRVEALRREFGYGYLGSGTNLVEEEPDFDIDPGPEADEGTGWSSEPAEDFA